MRSLELHQRGRALGGQAERLSPAVARIRRPQHQPARHQDLERLDQVGLAHPHRLGEFGRAAAGVGLEHQEDGVAQLVDPGSGEAFAERAQVLMLGQAQPEAHGRIELGRIQRRARAFTTGGAARFRGWTSHEIAYTV